VESTLPIRLLIAAISAAVLVILGSVCLIWPKDVQRYALKSEERMPWNPFLPFMRTGLYLAGVQLWGLLAVSAGLVVVAVLLLGQH